MRIYLLNTPEGLKPCYDDDYDRKKKLKIGVTYKADVAVARNLRFHNKYFKLLRCAWAYQDEATDRFFHSKFESFRETVEVAAGICRRFYNISKKSWEEVPKSISFDSMDDMEFPQTYESVRNVLFTVFLKNVSEHEFMSNLSNF